MWQLDGLLTSLECRTCANRFALDCTSGYFGFVNIFSSTDTPTHAREMSRDVLVSENAPWSHSTFSLEKNGLFLPTRSRARMRVCITNEAVKGCGLSSVINALSGFARGVTTKHRCKLVCCTSSVHGLATCDTKIPPRARRPRAPRKLNSVRDVPFRPVHAE